MKRFASLLVCLTLVLAMVVCASALVGENYALFSSSSDVDIPINEHIGGDANGDGTVTLLDVVAALRATIGDVYNTSRDAVDADEDGTVSVKDVLLIIRHVVGDEVGLGSLVPAK